MTRLGIRENRVCFWSELYISGSGIVGDFYMVEILNMSTQCPSETAPPYSAYESPVEVPSSHDETRCLLPLSPSGDYI